MRTPFRVVASIFGAAVLLIVVVLIVQATVPRAPVAPIQSIEYHQTQSAPDFDDSVHTVSDPARIAQFTALVKKYGIDVTRFDTSLNDVCTGGLVTDITLKFQSAPSDTLRIYDCAKPVPKGTFVTDATALFTGWSAAD